MRKWLNASSDSYAIKTNEIFFLKKVFMNKQFTSIIIKILVVVLLLTPLIYILSFYKGLHVLPNYDYWSMFSEMIRDGEINASIDNLIARSNEHIVVVPKLLYLINYYTVQGSNKGLFFFNILMVAVQLILCLRITRELEGQYRYLGFIVSSFLLFSPTAAHNWLLSMSGNAWFTANMLSLSIFAIYAIQNYDKNVSLSNSFSTIFLILLAALTYSTGVYAALTIIMISIVDLFYKIHTGKSKLIRIIITFISLLIFLIWYLTYNTPSHHPELEYNTFIIYQYVFGYLGGIATTNLNTAFLIGGFGLLIFVLLCFYAFKVKFNHIPLRFGFMICSYSIISALTSAVARSGFGLEYALSSRYASLSQLFWLGIVIMLLSYLQNNKNNYKLLVASVLCAGTILMIYTNGVLIINNFRDRFSEQHLAALSLQIGAHDLNLIQRTITPAPDQLLTHIDNYKKIQHVPFADNIHEQMFENILDFYELYPYKDITANIIDINNLNDNSYKVKGSIIINERHIEISRIIFTKADGTIIGFALLDSKAEGIDGYEWSGYLHKPGEGLIDVYGLNEQDLLMPFRTSFQVD